MLIQQAKSAKKKKNRAAGFSLIELMIVVAIVGIIASIAYPSYQRYVINSNRTAATACLVELAQFMERRFSANMAYPGTLPGRECNTSGSLSARYAFSLNEEESDPTSFRVEASPRGPQRTDECGTVSIDHSGQRRASGEDANVDQCW